MTRIFGMTDTSSYGQHSQNCSPPFFALCWFFVANFGQTGIVYESRVLYMLSVTRCTSYRDQKHDGIISVLIIVWFRFWISLHTTMVSSPWFLAYTIHEDSCPDVGNASSRITLMWPGLSTCNRSLTSCPISKMKYKTNNYITVAS